jgi:hypothetical protein
MSHWPWRTHLALFGSSEWQIIGSSSSYSLMEDVLDVSA